jgi:hypothetical protein
VEDAVVAFLSARSTHSQLFAKPQTAVRVAIETLLNTEFDFFITVSVTGSFTANINAKSEEIKEETKGKQVTIVFGVGDALARLDKDGNFICSLPKWMCERLRPKAERLQNQPVTELSNALTRFQRDWPYVMFVLMPLFAIMLKVVYLRRNWLYGEHLVFALHIHAAWFAFGLFVLLLPSFEWIPVVAMVIYTILAMRRVYTGRKRATFTRATILFVIYSFAVLVAIAILMIYELLFQ